MILLSICIPTYNHDCYLRKMLSQLTSLESFGNGEMEIIISDNASSDDTRSIGENFAHKFPGTVKYFRNETNICDKNFEKALSHGNGLFLKLANDTLLFSEQGIEVLLDTIRKYSIDKPVLFFSNSSPNQSCKKVFSFDEFFNIVSFHSTWIGSFGIWRSDFLRLKDFSRKSCLQLAQVDVLCRMLNEKRFAIVEEFNICSLMPRDVIGGYNLSKVFGNNYFTIIGEYVSNSVFSKKAFILERYRMLRYHILPFYIKISKHNSFPKTGYVKYLLKWCWRFPLYWAAMPFVIISGIVASILSMKSGR